MTDGFDTLLTGPRIIPVITLPSAGVAAPLAGARFVVSPGLHGGVVERCRALGVPPVPGIATATEPGSRP